MYNLPSFWSRLKKAKSFLPHFVYLAIKTSPILVRHAWNQKAHKWKVAVIWKHSKLNYSLTCLSFFIQWLVCLNKNNIIPWRTKLNLFGFTNDVITKTATDCNFSTGRIIFCWFQTYVQWSFVLTWIIKTEEFFIIEIFNYFFVK